MIQALKEHWPEYVIDGALLGIFMVVACCAVAAFEHPESPLNRAIRRPVIRRGIIALLMGLTAVGLIYSPWGARSGAHMNPAMTFAFYALGRVGGADAVFFIVAQFVGGLLGVAAAAAVLGPVAHHPAVNCAVTQPGARGHGGAFAGEFVVSFVMMLMVLWATNHAETASYTGLIAGALVCGFIALEAPFSGMSLNPARTLASAIPARAYRGLWIYLTAPPLAMLAAAWVYSGVAGPGSVYCARLNHTGDWRCIFHCRIEEMPGRATPARDRGIR